MKPCGTRAAYNRHLNNGEAACGPCKEANRLQQQQIRRSRGAKPRVDSPCGTSAGYQRHRRSDEEPCGACREAWNEYMRLYRRGESVHSNYDRIRQADTTVDVMLTRGYPLRADVIAELVCEIHPEWSQKAIRRVLHRLQDDGLVQVVERLEPLWRVTDAGEEWFYMGLAS